MTGQLSGAVQKLAYTESIWLSITRSELLRDFLLTPTYPIEKVTLGGILYLESDII